MDKALLDVMLFFCAFLLHEAGHWLFIKILGYKAKFSLSPLGGVGVGETKDFYKMKVFEVMIVLVAGVLAGTFPLLFATNNIVWAFYVFLSSADISNTIELWETTIRSGKRIWQHKVAEVIKPTLVDNLRLADEVLNE